MKTMAYLLCALAIFAQLACSQDSAQQHAPISYVLAPDGKAITKSEAAELFATAEYQYGSRHTRNTATGLMTVTHILFRTREEYDEFAGVDTLRSIGAQRRQYEDKRDPGTIVRESLFKQQLPAFSEISLSGEEWSNTRLDGSTVVITYWFISCGGCVAEIPELNKLVSQYENRDDVVFLSFTTDPPEALGSFLADHPFDFEVIPVSEEHVQARGIYSAPVHLVVQPGGLIQAVITGVPLEFIRHTLDTQISISLSSG